MMHAPQDAIVYLPVYIINVRWKTTEHLWKFRCFKVYCTW